MTGPQLPRKYLRKAGSLFLDKGLAVGASLHRGVHLMGADGDAGEAAIIFTATVVAAARNITFDRTVRSIHLKRLPFVQKCPPFSAA